LEAPGEKDSTFSSIWNRWSGRVSSSIRTINAREESSGAESVHHRSSTGGTKWVYLASRRKLIKHHNSRSRKKREGGLRRVVSIFWEKDQHHGAFFQTKEKRRRGAEKVYKNSVEKHRVPCIYLEKRGSSGRKKRLIRDAWKNTAEIGDRTGMRG